MTSSQDISLSLPWVKDDDPAYGPGRAWASQEQWLTINDLFMHAVAYRVTDIGGVQMAHLAVFQEEVERIQDSAGGRLTTVKLFGPDGGDWVIEITPHGD